MKLYLSFEGLASALEVETDLPVALGVIRDVEAPSYETCVAQQVEEAKAKHGFSCLRDVILTGDTWEVK